MTQVDTVSGDITAQRVDAVVNAANSSLLGGGGVDGAIHRAAGPALLQACRDVRRDVWPQGLPVGEAVATPAGRLHARWVVHTVAPNRGRGQTDERDLAACYARSLEVAAGVGAASIAFPALGCGLYGWGPDSARVAVDAVAASPVLHRFELVRFVLFGPELFRAFTDVVAQAFPETS